MSCDGPQLIALRLTNRQLPKSHRLRLHCRVLRVCVPWFLRDFRNPARTPRGNARSADPERKACSTGVIRLAPA
jgi:hypothetical protein